MHAASSLMQMPPNFCDQTFHDFHELIQKLRSQLTYYSLNGYNTYYTAQTI